MIPVSEWNHAIGFIGVPGTGKSTVAVQRLLEFGRTPAYLLCHDPTWRVPTKLPDGQTATIHRHVDLATACAALKTNPKGIHAPTVKDGAEILHFAHEVAVASKGGERVPIGTPAIPVAVLIDEARALQSSAPGQLRGKLLDLLVGRRWEHTALLYTVQSPSMVDVGMLGQASELYIFRVIDEKGRKRLRDEAGVPEAILEEVASWPEGSHEYRVHRL